MIWEIEPGTKIVEKDALPEPLGFDSPQMLYEQLEPRGRLVVPVGRRRVQRLEVVVRSPEGPAVIRSVPCRFVPLVGEQGFNGG